MPTPITPAPPPADMRNPEQLEAGIVTALRDRDIGTSTRLLSLLANAEKERADAVYAAMMLGTSFAAEPELRAGTTAVDFDGVIHAYSAGWGDGTIYDRTKPGALTGLWALGQLGPVFVFTSREVGPVAHWLHARQVPVAVEHGPIGVGEVQFWDERDRVLVTNRKLPARWYLDDRAVPFRDTWSAALHDIAQRWTAARAGQKTRR